MEEYAAIFMFVAVAAILLAGYPVAFSLAGAALTGALIGNALDLFDPAFLEAVPNRIYGIMMNDTLMAVPLFVFMGVTLERSHVAEDLLETMALLFGRLRGGIAISVMVVGTLLAASTGIVGATVVTMGLLSLPTMLRRGYDPALAAGTICAAGTLGQIIPPSIVLVILGDVLSASYQQAQLKMGVFSPRTVSVGDLFVGAILPGLLLVVLYILYIAAVAYLQPTRAPAIPAEEREFHRKGLWLRVLRVLIPPVVLIISVMGSILAGLATPTEAASVGAVGSLIMATLRGRMNRSSLEEITRNTMRITSMVFMIFIGAAVFSLIFRGFHGDEMVHGMLLNLPGGVMGAMVVVMVIMFLLGFIIDFIEITYVVVPIVGPPLLALGLDPIWLGVMMGVNLQTSFLTPPFGFALFYLRGIAPPTLRTSDIYRGVAPFIMIQVVALVFLALWPSLATWLPGVIYGK